MSLPRSYDALKLYKHFVTYDLVPDPARPGRMIKRPTDVRTGRWCNAHNPAHQYSYEEAAATGRPVGYVLIEGDGFWCIDIDGAFRNGHWSPIARELFELCKGAAVETSQSLTGAHIIGRGTVPPHSCKNDAHHIELYTDKRFIALTGINAVGDAGLDLTDVIAEIGARYFPPCEGQHIVEWTYEPAAGYGGPPDDDGLIRAALASSRRSAAAAFGNKSVTFADLWNADADKLSGRWPGMGGGYDASKVDYSLARRLAFWTGKNCERIRALMLRSALGRPKWERADYLERTILRAVAVTTIIAGPRS
jgi:primase-polymerase (primpol)-like protein